MKNDEIEKFGLIIIESLPDDEKKTGYELYSTIIKYKTFEFPDLGSKCYDVNNRKDLFTLLKELVIKAVEENYFFILHIEIHGYDDGVVLKNGEEITWGEMIPYFQDINIHYRNYLTLVLGICRGASILKYINPSERAPFRSLISSEKDIYLIDLIPGFEEFYKNFFFELDAIKSLEKYNSIVNNPDDKLLLVSAEYCFDTIANIDRQTANKEMLKDIYKKRLLWDFPDLKYFPEEHTNNYIEAKIKTAFDDLKTKKNYFLMRDLGK